MYCLKKIRMNAAYFFVLIAGLCNACVEEQKGDLETRLHNLYLKNVQAPVKETGSFTDAKLFLNQKDIKLLYFNRSNPNDGILIKYDDVPKLQSFTAYDGSLKSVVFIHGWLDSCNLTSNAIRSSFMTHHSVNYFELCWDIVAFEEYIICRHSLSDVAKYFKNYLSALVENMGLDLSTLTIVGHSLGAHIAGLASEKLNSSVGYIVGLDAAGPFVFKNEKDRLKLNSAVYVQAIHTDSSFLGINFDVGNSDFWPNGGRVQPGCEFDIFGRCAHLRSMAYFAESLKNGEFFGRLCENYKEYSKGQCNQNLEKRFGGYLLDTSIVGDFYLDTNSTAPYALGHHDP